jgi:hypothetical protein
MEKHQRRSGMEPENTQSQTMTLNLIGKVLKFAQEKKLYEDRIYHVAMVLKQCHDSLNRLLSDEVGIMETGICPYCNEYTGFVESKEGFSVIDVNERGSNRIRGLLLITECDRCKKTVIFYRMPKQPDQIIWPRFVEKITAFGKLVPPEIATDFNEIEKVQEISPKSAAVLSRRLLQRILRTKFGCDEHNLSKQIISFGKIPDVPPEIFQTAEAINKSATFGAHPNFDEDGKIFDVTSDEAEGIVNFIRVLIEWAYIQRENMLRRLKDVEEKFKLKQDADKRNNK